MKKAFAFCIAVAGLLVSACNTAGTQDKKPAPDVPGVLVSPATPLDDVTLDNLEVVFGKATGAGSGSAVYRMEQAADQALDSIAFTHYKQYLGEKFTSEAASRWTAGWKKVYTRLPDSNFNIIREINIIPDPTIKKSLPLLLEFVEPVVKARQALAGAFSRKDVHQLAVYTVGDGGAYYGMMITAKFDDGRACSLIAMAD